MSRLEDDLRDLFLRNEESAPLVDPGEPQRIAHRTRRRQVLVAGTTAIVTVALVAGAVVAVSHLPGGTTHPADSSTRTRSSTVRGITLSYPADWTLTELTDEVNVNEGPAGPDGTIPGQAVFELSNFDPMDTGSSVFCDWGGWGGLPSDRAMLYVQTLDFPRVPGSTPEAWPVDLGRPTAGSPGATETGDEAYATWTAQGSLYEAFLCGWPGPALERLRTVFSTMTFGAEGPDAQTVTAPDGAPVPGPIYVLDSGIEEGQRWNLLAFASRYPLVPTRICIALEVAGTVLDPQCDLEAAAAELTGDEMLGMEGTGHLVSSTGTEIFYVWGAVPPAVDELRARLDSGTATLISRVPLPPSFGVGFDAVIAVGTHDVSGEIRSIVDGETRGYFPFIAGPTPALPTGTFEVREVLEMVPSGAPGWDALEVTCIDVGGSPDCLDPDEAAGQEVVLLDSAGGVKSRLAPTTVTAADVASAAAVELDPQTEQGWGIVVQLTPTGAQAFEDLTTGLVGKQLAVVSDGVVLTAPTVQAPITSGAIQVGGLSQAAAEALAQRLDGGGA